MQILPLLAQKEDNELWEKLLKKRKRTSTEITNPIHKNDGALYSHYHTTIVCQETVVYILSQIKL